MARRSRRAYHGAAAVPGCPPRGGAGMATVVIIHGLFGGGWQWQQVRRGLQAAGHEVYGPTLTGMGERSHLASPDIDLDTHVQDVRNVLEYENLREAVLVGNAYGGTLAAILADRVPE